MMRTRLLLRGLREELGHIRDYDLGELGDGHELGEKLNEIIEVLDDETKRWCPTCGDDLAVTFRGKRDRLITKPPF
jgi:hypothetical protein